MEGLLRSLLNRSFHNWGFTKMSEKVSIFIQINQWENLHRHLYLQTVSESRLIILNKF